MAHERGQRWDEVVELIRRRVADGSRPGDRRDSRRLAVVIEGGANRGAITGGMGLQLHERGLLGAVDHLYGASSGAITAAWLASPHPERLVGWTDPSYTKMLVRRTNLLRRRPLVDLRTLTDVVYTHLAPMDFAGVLASPTPWHPVATDTTTGKSVDLRPFLRDPADVKLALRASCGIPFLAGAPVELGGRRFVDAGVAEPIPYLTALAQGATHLVIVRSRRRDELPRHSPAAPVLGRALRGRYPAAYRRALVGATARYQAHDRRLATWEADTDVEAEPAALLVLRPAAGTPDVARFATNGPVLTAAFEAGRAAVRDVFDA